MVVRRDHTRYRHPKSAKWEANVTGWGAAFSLFGLLIIAVSPALGQEANLPAEVRASITEMGATLNQEVIEKTVKMMAPLQAPRADLNVTKDLEYGADPLQKLDVYSPKGNATEAAPVILFVHGGGFRSLDKSGQQNIA